MAENIQLPPTPAPEDMPVNRNIGDGLCVMTWVLLGVSTVLVGGRMMSKTLVLRRFRWDDVFLLLTWATSIGYSVLIQLAYHHGFGRHSLYLEIPHALKLLKYAYICQMFCVLTPMFGRIAVTLYTLSLLGRTKAYLRYFLWSLLWLQVIFNVAIAITLLSACGTDMTIIANPATTCYRQSPWSRFAQFIGAFNAFTDGALSLAPGFVISGLRTTTRAKLAACCLLCLSSLASVAAIWRTIEIDKIFDADWDFTFNAVPYFYASSFEQSIIMITASIPTLGPIARHIRHKTSTTFSGSKHGSVVLSNSTASASRHDSSESTELQKNLSHALGIHLPGLGNTVVITGGAAKKGRKNSRDSVLPLSDIKATTRTDVKVETAPAYSTASGEEDVESLFNMPKTMSREGK